MGLGPHEGKLMNERGNTRKNFFTVGLMEHWNWCLREVMESPLKVFKTHLSYATVGNLL